ncbi:snapalysin [Streptomyces sp. bgisy022]|uniref:snapalysin n=1 Tax=Streptomyces sp. bgisy022 TaxID=3413769 RepID=UPI003D703859
MRLRMPLSVLTAAGLSLATLGLGTAGPASATPTAEGAPVVAYGSPSAGPAAEADAQAEARADRAFFEAVLRSVAEKRAANPKSAAAVTVVYNASRAPSFATQIARSTQIWNSSVSNVKLQAGTSGADFSYREGNDPRGSYASTDGHGRGYIFLDYRQNQTYDSTRVTAHETGHVLGLRDNYSGPCSELMSGGGPGPSCTNAYPNAAERSRVNQLWANGLAAAMAEVTDKGLAKSAR